MYLDGSNPMCKVWGNFFFWRGEVSRLASYEIWVIIRAFLGNCVSSIWVGVRNFQTNFGSNMVQ